MGKYESYNLMLQSYCEFCPDFEPNIEKTEITVLNDTTIKTLTAIRCRHEGRCERMYARIKEKAHETATEI